MRVVFVQKFVPHYRLPFFERVRARLAERGIPFVLIYGQPDPYEGSKVKMEYPEWGHRVKSRIIKVAGRYLYWEGAIFRIKRHDMVIAEHAAKLLDNYFLYLASRMGFIGFGYFGHGENFQTKHELSISRFVKKAMLTKVTRWFAYTEVSRQSLLRQGVDDQNITVVNNTLDKPDYATDAVEKQPNKFLYIGGLYADKRLDLLLDAAEQVAAKVDNFELHVVGDGPMRNVIEQAAESHAWVTYHGSLYGEERNHMLASSVAILMPGLVGLVAIDSFFFQCPVLTSDVGQHSPEIAYLTHGENALVDTAEGTADTYAQMVLRFIEEPGLADKLRTACDDSSNLYTIDNMVERFCDGIELCRRDN